MSIVSFKDELYDQFARITKALANGSRIELLDHLAQGERSVEALAKVSGLKVSNTSKNLQQLRQAGLVTTRREGAAVYYRLSDDDVVELLEVLRQVAERHLADVDRLVTSFLTVKDDLEPVPAQELLQRARDGVVTVLDVRSIEEYRSGHLPGAVNIPLAELEQRLKDLDNTREVIAYCRGSHCVLAFDAVARLRQQGFRARRLQIGFPAWQHAGYPVEH